MLKIIIISSLMAFAAQAGAQVLASGSGVQLSTQDTEADLQRVPLELRQNIYSRPADVISNLENLYVRRVMANEASKLGLDKTRATQAALALAQDRILSDAYLSRFDAANTPELTKLEAFARTVYDSNPKRFEAPEQVSIKHLLLPANNPSAKTEAAELLKQLQAGANFEALASAHSKDPGSAAKGGDLGWVARGRMVKPFEEAAFALTTAGTLSPVIETQFGFHIIKLEARKAAGIQSFDDVKAGLVKESEFKLRNEARMVERDRILATATFDQPAIEAFAKTQAKPSTPAPAPTTVPAPTPAAAAAK